MPVDTAPMDEGIMPVDTAPMDEGIMPVDTAPMDEGIMPVDTAPMDEGIMPVDAAPMDEGVMPVDTAPMDEGVMPVDRSVCWTTDMNVLPFVSRSEIEIVDLDASMNDEVVTSLELMGSSDTVLDTADDAEET